MTTKTAEGPNPGPGYLHRPEHEVKLRAFGGRVIAMMGEKVLASSDHAILLTESGSSPVYYLPKGDISFDLFEDMDLSTHCPFKGQARYWRLRDGGKEPVLWGYDEPYDEVAELKGYVAFYGDRVNLQVQEAA